MNKKLIKLTKLINCYGTINKVPSRLLLSFRNKDLSKLPNQLKNIVQSTMKNLSIDKKVFLKKQKKSKTIYRNRECANKQDDNCEFYLQNENHIYLTESELTAQNKYNKLEELTRQREVAREKYWKKCVKEQRERELKYRLFKMYLEEGHREMERQMQRYERYKDCLKKDYEKRNRLLLEQATLVETQENIEYQIAMCNYNIQNNPLYGEY